MYKCKVNVNYQRKSFLFVPQFIKIIFSHTLIMQVYGARHSEELKASEAYIFIKVLILSLNKEIILSFYFIFILSNNLYIGFL